MEQPGKYLIDNEIDSISRINEAKKKKKKANIDSAVENTPEEAPAVITSSDQSIPEIQNLSPDQLIVSHNQLKDMLETAQKSGIQKILPEIESLKESLQQKDQEIRDIRKAYQEEKSVLKDQLQATQRQKETLTKIFSDFGYSPNAENTASSVYVSSLNNRGNSISPKDAVLEFDRIFNDKVTQPTMVVNPQTGRQYIQLNNHHLKDFILEHRKALRDGVEGYLKKAGFLRGSSSAYIGADAPTSLTSLPPMVQSYLSEITRIEHEARFILWQFVNREIAVGIPPGQTTLVPRIKHLTAPTTAAGWRLTPENDLTTDTQALTGSTQSIVIAEWGMGKDANHPVVSIPEFWIKNSLIDLERVLQSRLGYNYHQFEDQAIFEMLLSTTAVRYNNGGDVVTAPADVTATGATGQLTFDFLTSLFSHMDILKIPTFPDGKYVYVCPSTHKGQIQKDLSEKHRYIDKESMEELTNMIANSTSNTMMGRMTGYYGTIAGFHIYSGNSFSLGAAGTAGAQNENFGASPGTARLTRSGFAFGPDSMGWATSMPMQIQSEPWRFNRGNEFTWCSHEGYGALDIDPNTTSPANDQQLRVLEIRTPDIAL